MQVKIYIFGLIIFASVCFAGCGITQNSRTEIAEEVIRNNPEFKETDNFCKQIPLPEGTNFIGKSRLWKSVGLSFYYHSDKKPEDLQKFFQEYITKNGWEPLKPDTPVALTADFRNDKFEVFITLTGIKGIVGEENFSIECEKLNTRRK